MTGKVRVKVHKGNATVIGLESAMSLYDEDLVSFEDGTGGYDQRDSTGLTRLNAPRLRLAARRMRRGGQPNSA